MYLWNEKLAQTQNMLFVKDYKEIDHSIIIYPKFPYDLKDCRIPCWMLIESGGQAAELYSRIRLQENGKVYLTKIENFDYPSLKNIDTERLRYKPELISQFDHYIHTEVKMYMDDKRIVSIKFVHYYYS